MGRYPLLSGTPSSVPSSKGDYPAGACLNIVYIIALTRRRLATDCSWFTLGPDLSWDRRLVSRGRNIELLVLKLNVLLDLNKIRRVMLCMHSRFFRRKSASCFET